MAKEEVDLQLLDDVIEVLSSVGAEEVVPSPCPSSSSSSAACSNHQQPYQGHQPLQPHQPHQGQACQEHQFQEQQYQQHQYKIPVDLGMPCQSEHSFKMELSHYVKYVIRAGKHTKVWECGICSKEFSHQYTLMRHLPTHTDERKFQCNTCGKAFRQMSTLSQHRAIHSAERPYVCEVCRKTFNRVSTLISHRKTHTGLKPHRCHLCNKAFHQKGNLRNHIFTHTNERPYKCDVCSKGFNQMSNLMCHKLKAHQRADKPHYTCQTCGKVFPKRMALRKHQQCQHGGQPSQPQQLQPQQMQPQQMQLQQMQPQQPEQLQPDQLQPQQLQPDQLQQDQLQQDQLQQDQLQQDQLQPDHLQQDQLLTEQTEVLLAQPQSATGSSGARVRYTNGVLVDPIATEAMCAAMSCGQTPFALLRPLNGIPVLVRVLNAGSKQMLVPATAEDLRRHGQITITCADNATPSESTVQIKIPVVATVIQRCEVDGQMTMAVQSPGPRSAAGAGQNGLEVLGDVQEFEENIDFQMLPYELDGVLQPCTTVVGCIDDQADAGDAQLPDDAENVTQMLHYTVIDELDELLGPQPADADQMHGDSDAGAVVVSELPIYEATAQSAQPPHTYCCLDQVLNEQKEVETLTFGSDITFEEYAAARSLALFADNLYTDMLSE